jgi:hypothetical protein
MPRRTVSILELSFLCRRFHVGCLDGLRDLTLRTRVQATGIAGNIFE